MLKELFESSFYVTYPHKKNVLPNLMERTYEKDFSLRDEKACKGCKDVCHTEDAFREQLLVKTDTSVNALKLDVVFELVKEPIGDNCDYLLEDDKKSALIEMTCSNKDYVKSKRTKAKEQLLSTLEMLYTNSIIRIHFERKSEKYVVFSWRDTTKRDRKDDLASRNMLEMTKMSDATYSPDNESRFEFDFKYKEIRYPDKLVWGK